MGVRLSGAHKRMVVWTVWIYDGPDDVVQVYQTPCSSAPLSCGCEAVYGLDSVHPG